MWKPIDSIVKDLISISGLPVTSCSLQPINFGNNVVLEGHVRSYPTMLRQIILALETAKEDVVFFTEHDVLYHPSHFRLNIERDDVYYYNINNWRWLYPDGILTSFDGLSSLSALYCNRELAIKHFNYRLKVAIDQQLDPNRSREPRWARKFGYEPGTKKCKTGGITDEDYVKTTSEYPNIDIRHGGNFSRPYIRKEQFKTVPSTWKEAIVDDIPGWNLKNIFDESKRNNILLPWLSRR
jgi:hypothetical protein